MSPSNHDDLYRESFQWLQHRINPLRFPGAGEPYVMWYETRFDPRTTWGQVLQRACNLKGFGRVRIEAHGMLRAEGALWDVELAYVIYLVVQDTGEDYVFTIPIDDHDSYIWEVIPETPNEAATGATTKLRANPDPSLEGLCSNCVQPSPDGSAFCIWCGQPLLPTA